MTNDLTTVEGSFQQLIDDLENNLQEKGVNAQYDATTGIRGLVAKILDIKSKNVIARVTGDSISLGENTTWLTSIGDVVIDWGDGTSDTVNNPSTTVSHTYTDGLNEHFIIFDGAVTSIEKGCFSGNLNLTTILILDSVTSLGNRCFESCSNLTSVVISDSVTSLGDNCFYGCSGLTSIVIPDSVTSLGDSCFYGCSGLTSIVIPDSVTSLGNNCFYGCSDLTSITIPNNVTYLGTNCFNNCTSLVDYELYWETQPVTYNSTTMPVNNNTVFTIPYGTTSIYVDAGYPSERLVERIPPADTITITSTKDILSAQYNEFAIITATLYGGGIPIPNTELYCTIVDKDDNLLANGTTTTNAHGKANASYIATGVGDVTVTFSLGSLLQKTYVIEDCEYYDTTTHNTGNESINITLQSPNSVKIEFDFTKVTSGSRAIARIGDNDSNHFQVGLQGGGYYGFWILHKGSNQIQQSSTSLPNGTYHCEFTYEDGVATSKINNQTKTYTYNQPITKILQCNCSGSGSIKNIKVKPL